MNLKPYNCTIRVFDTGSGQTIEEHVLPVDSPDPEHAVASTLANAASFIIKTEGDTAKSIAFACVKIELR